MWRLWAAATILAISVVGGSACGAQVDEESPPPEVVDQATRTTPPTTQPPETTPPGVDREEVVGVGGPEAAGDLRAEPACSQTELRKSIATLSWSVARNPGTAQRVDVTTSPEGFEEGQFQSSERLPPDVSRIVWEDLDSGIVQHWRILTLQPGGWWASRTASFQAPVCVADFVSPAG